MLSCTPSSQIARLPCRFFVWFLHTTQYPCQLSPDGLRKPWVRTSLFCSFYKISCTYCSSLVWSLNIGDHGCHRAGWPSKDTSSTIDLNQLNTVKKFGNAVLSYKHSKDVMILLELLKYCSCSECVKPHICEYYYKDHDPHKGLLHSTIEQQDTSLLYTLGKQLRPLQQLNAIRDCLEGVETNQHVFSSLSYPVTFLIMVCYHILATHA